MKVKKNTKKKEVKEVKKEVKPKVEKVEKKVEEKPKKVETPKVKMIQIKQRSFDAETGFQYNSWVVGKQFKVIGEDNDTFTFGNEANMKLGVVRKEDCVEV